MRQKDSIVTQYNKKVTMIQSSLKNCREYLFRDFLEYTATLCHWGAPLEVSHYPYIINRISFICYAEYCY